MRFTESYSGHFNKSGREHARVYLSGLLGTQRRKNMGRMEEEVEGSNYQGLQQFVSSSPWDHNEVIRHVGQEASEVLGKQPDSALYLDETSFVKKGDGSHTAKNTLCSASGTSSNYSLFTSLAKIATNTTSSLPCNLGTEPENNKV